MRLLRTLRLTNLLSYGPESEPIELEPLNVLIGPNGSGKSNLIEAISLLKAAPRDIEAPIRRGGGLPEWFFKGTDRRENQLRIAATVEDREGVSPLHYALDINSMGRVRELIEVSEPHPDGSSSKSVVHNSGWPVERSDEAASPPGAPEVRARGFKVWESVLAQLKEPERHPQITYLAEVFSEIRLFREWNVGRTSPLREPQRADEPANYLLEDGRNLGVVLSDLLNQPTTKRTLLGKLGRFYEYVEDVTSKVYAGRVETFFHERGFGEATPLVRLSDGTLRYLCLLVILCHPEPPPLVCIEDPEIGLHPDILPRVAELLVEASQRMQLIVTTHSDVLVSALSHVPEAVVVCERDDLGSHLRRLQPDQLQEWLQKYTLGELWRMGETGGNP